ncbi:arabinogalactan protein 16-like [Malania oleifera]|uniref:arabinogalactan protein 16-like n=1 Tax=Malania oleifera TaxID=397392 RepID=UPI0025AE5A8C|nr:arabinogalactan protein 16-like [Malania oleifera]
MQPTLQDRKNPYPPPLLPSASASFFYSLLRMAVSRAFAAMLLPIFAFALATLLSPAAAQPQPAAPTPSPAAAQPYPAAPTPSPTSDGTSIDQGIAYVLMLLALVLTYLIHTWDASSYGLF